MLTLICLILFVDLTGNGRATDVSVFLQLEGTMTLLVLTCFVADRLTFHDKLDQFHKNFLNAEILRAVNVRKIQS